MIPGTKKLAKLHGMNLEGLDKELKRLRDVYLLNKAQTVPTKEDVKKILGPIARTAEELNDRLRDLRPMIRQRLDIPKEDGESLLDNLSIELPSLQTSANELMDKWSKSKSMDRARNMVILQLTIIWKNLTNKPATYSTPKNKNTGVDPDNPPPKYYCGNRCGEFLDFLTVAACELIKVERTEGIRATPDAIVRQFVELKRKHKHLM